MEWVNVIPNNYKTEDTIIECWPRISLTSFNTVNSFADELFKCV